FINDKTKKECKDWAEKHLNWTTTNWKNHIWRRPGEEFNDDCFVPAIKSKEIMMWDVFFGG
ncbi:3712_t:CDS:2, partial [Dentiscutata heterogama]